MMVKKVLHVIPCYYKFEYIEWKDRDKGAVAPVNVYPADSDIMSKTTRGDDGKDRLENGNYIEETASHYVMVVEEGKNINSINNNEVYSKKKNLKVEFNDDVFKTKKKKMERFFKPAPFTQTIYNENCT